MLNFLLRNIPSFASKNCPLRDLLKDEILLWEQHHETSLKEIKHTIVSNLAYFNKINDVIQLEVNASKHGLWPRISSGGNIFGHVSRSLNKSEQNYSQLEKELFAIVCGVKHFHRYIYGQRIDVITDDTT